MDPCGGAGRCLRPDHVHSGRSGELRDGRKLTGTTTEVAALGPYFAVDLHRPGQRPDAPWRPMTELLDHPELLLQRIESVQRSLAAGAGVAPGAIQWRVAASTVHLGLVARLLAPALAITVLTNQGPQVSLTELYWQPAGSGPYPLSLPESPPAIERSSAIEPVSITEPLSAFHPYSEDIDDRVAADFARWLTTGPIEQLTRATLAAGAISEIVLRGNVASAVHTAAQQVATARPDLRDRTTALLDTVAHQPSLHGTGRLLPSGGFRRNSCCLIYRALRPMPGADARAICGDCVLTGD